MAESITKSIGYKNRQTISYAEYGDKNGFPVLINHGMIASIRDGWLFDRLIRLGAHLVCIARPGYGESSPFQMQNIGQWADIVSVLIEELHLARFDVFGMSSGLRIAMPWVTVSRTECGISSSLVEFLLCMMSGCSPTGHIQ